MLPRRIFSLKFVRVQRNFPRVLAPCTLVWPKNIAFLPFWHQTPNTRLTLVCCKYTLTPFSEIYEAFSRRIQNIWHLPTQFMQLISRTKIFRFVDFCAADTWLNVYCCVCIVFKYLPPSAVLSRTLLKYLTPLAVCRQRVSVTLTGGPSDDPP